MYADTFLASLSSELMEFGSRPLNVRKTSALHVLSHPYMMRRFGVFLQVRSPLKLNYRSGLSWKLHRTAGNYLQYLMFICF